MTYLGELRQNIRPLAAASLGCGTSLPLFAYTNSVFAPFLVREFGWSRAQFALVGLTMLTTLAVLPFVGRFTDRFGVWRVALVGTILVPLCFVAYALQNGSFYYFLGCSAAVLAIGAMTGPLVYSRLVAENFVRAQGLALTIINCAPAVLAIVCVPALNWTILHYGWRLSYLGLGALALVAGLMALALIRPVAVKHDATAAPMRAPSQQKSAREDYGMILRSKVFWLIIVAFFLCMLQTPLHSSQMNIMLLDQHLSPDADVAAQFAANIVSVYAFGTIVGRIACGLALDRFPTPIVTCLSMILPALGFFMLGTPFDAVEVVTAAMFLVGISVGAESDLLCFLVARYFKLRIYNSTLGLVHCMSFLTSATGAAAISLTLKLTDSFTPFLFLVSGTIAVGSLLFLALPRSCEFEKIG